MKVVLKHAGQWLHFQCPEKVLVAERVEDVLPMLYEAEQSGLFVAGFLSYEAAPAFDPALKAGTSDDFPLLCIGLFDEPEVLDGIEAASAASYDVGELIPSVSKQEFVDAIAIIKERIAEGATYQVNYTYRLNASFSGDAWKFFHDLVQGQKTECAAFVETDDLAVCSVSPELFFSIHDGHIMSRPMKGTAKRGRTFAEDRQQAEALLTSEKDRAENIMIVDMVRNDIGRIAEPGTVHTVSTYDVEKYPTVWQMTSTVTGRINHEDPKNAKVLDGGRSEASSLLGKPSVGLIQVMQALFPCASITGAPKAKTMEIIRDLETTPRKIYTGAIGFVAPGGDAAFSVAIRTALIDRENGLLEYGVGGGVVWDSDAASEYEETLIKARVLTEPRPDFKLLETMLWDPSTGIFLLDEHLQRIERSADYFDVPLNLPVIQARLDQLVSGFEHNPHRIRLLVARDGAVEVQGHRFPSDRQADHAAAIRIQLAKAPVDSNDIFLYHKTTHRAVYEKAKADFPDCGDVILWNERGEVTEGCLFNVVIEKNGKRITPPVESGLLAGTFREHLLRNGEIEEGIVRLDDLRSADEVFLVNSVRKWHKTVWAEGKE